MLSTPTIQPKSTVELDYMCPRGLSGPTAVTRTKWLKYEKRFQLAVRKLIAVRSTSPQLVAFSFKDFYAPILSKWVGDCFVIDREPVPTSGDISPIQLVAARFLKINQDFVDF